MTELEGIRSTTTKIARTAEDGPVAPTTADRAGLEASMRGKTREDANRIADRVAPGDTATTLGEVKPLSPTNIVPADQLAKDLLANNRGLFIGEEHSVGNPPYQMLKNNMGDFSRAGVKVVGLETFDKEDQHLLDAYRADPSAANRDALTKASKWDVGAKEWVDMVDEAHKNGIRVVGMDTAARKDINHGLSRHEVNSRWANAIDTAMAQEPPGSKFIAYGGRLHSGTEPFKDGVNQIMGIPSIVPANRNEYSEWDYYMKGGGYGVLGNSGNEYYALETRSPN